jgi:transcriptional regulator with XRE-family HTH domain
MSKAKRQLARRLRAAREKRGLTQTTVAKALGLHRPAISEIEAGRRSVDSEELSELSLLYGVSLSDLLHPSDGNERAATANAIETAIAQMASIIVERFDPERIILFGSHARGSAGPDSDVDLLVLMEVRGSKRRMAAEIGAALHGFRLPKDIIVTTPSEFEERKDVVGTIERPAAREGRVLYVRR